MDKTRAAQLSKRVIGKSVSGWTIQKYINCGKSAAVFEATRDSETAAIKIFDPELIERFGAEVQKHRIDREKFLIGKTHPNLVKIYDGGHWSAEDLYFVIMEFLPWKNLADVLADVPVGRERELIAQLASAAHFLEGLEICHRDIKPENVGVSIDFATVKLLDLGVIKPQGSKPITDASDAKVFVGTLKYSPPEFLLRQEKQTTEGWRAITFYQLGAVLHDLIMRRPLFADFEQPFARLVNAVQHETPAIDSTSVSPALVELARHCLLKPPELRLEFVSWEQFENEPAATDQLAALRSRVSKRTRLTSYAGTAKDKAEMSKTDAKRKLDEYAHELQTMCRLESIEGASVFPPVEINTVTCRDNACCFVVDYEPSKQRSLAHHLRLQVAISWIDKGNNAVEISASAFTSSACLDKTKRKTQLGRTIHRGIYAADTVRRRLAFILYAALDIAQQQNGPNAGRSRSKKPVASELTLPEVTV
jgi:serine/threonine protein kinase